MKKLILIAALVVGLVDTAIAEGWKGKNILVKPASLLCDYFHIEKALILLRAEDRDPINSWVNKGYCVVTANSFHATVIDDTSSFSNWPSVQVFHKGDEWWVSKGHSQCCYTKSNGEWKFYDPVKLRAERTARLIATFEAEREAKRQAEAKEKEANKCPLARQHLNDLKGAGLFGTAQYEKTLAIVEECAGEN